MKLFKGILFFSLSFLVFSASGMNRLAGPLKKLWLSSASLTRVTCWTGVSGTVPVVVGGWFSMKYGVDPITMNIIFGASATSALAGCIRTTARTPEVQYNQQVKELGRLSENPLVACVYTTHCKHTQNPIQKAQDVYTQEMLAAIDRHYVEQKLPRVTAFKELREQRRNFELVMSRLQNVDHKFAKHNGPFSPSALACQDALAQAQGYVGILDGAMIDLKNDPKWAARLKAYYQQKSSKEQKNATQELSSTRRATWLNSFANLINALRKRK